MLTRWRITPFGVGKSEVRRNRSAGTLAELSERLIKSLSWLWSLQRWNFAPWTCGPTLHLRESNHHVEPNDHGSNGSTSLQNQSELLSW